MHSNRSLIMGTVVLLGVCAGSVGLFIWPNYMEASRLKGEAAALQQQIADLEHRSTALETLAQTLAQLQQRVQQECKTIPASADLATLIRRLSQEVDRVNVVDQTFTAGSPADATIVPPAAGGKSSGGAGSGGVAKSALQAMPLTVDMEANFDSVFALLQRVESLDRLVRVASVRIGLGTNRTGSGNSRTSAPAVRPDSTPVLRASIGLEAIYDPAPPQSMTASATAKEDR
jgi:Tfp pilus assembly protein PilO